MFRVRLAVGMIALLVAVPGMAAAQQLASNAPSATSSDFGPRYWGQSFTVAGSGSYGNIQFSFLDQAGNNVANGTLYVFDHDCSATCAPNNLATQGGIASQLAANNVYAFGNALSANAGQTYYAYADTSQTVSYDNTSNPYAGGQAFNQRLSSPGTPFNNAGTSTDTAFSVTGMAIGAAPEPATWSLMILGFGLAGVALRRRRATAPMRAGA